MERKALSAIDAGYVGTGNRYPGIYIPGTFCLFQYRSHKPRNFCKIKNLNQKKG